MPLARQVMHNAGEDVHTAVWPAVKELHQIASRHYAFEGRCFVVAAGAIMRTRDLPRELEPVAALADNPDAMLLDGGSAVIGPDGLYVAGPAFDCEALIMARINLSRIREESLTLDVTGHYSRPDLFEFRARSEDGRSQAADKLVLDAPEPAIEPTPSFAREAQELRKS